MALVVVACVLCGCGAAGQVPVDPPQSQPVTTASLPAGGLSLAQLGFRNGPADRVSLPASVRLGVRVDQPNVVTATITDPGGPAIAGWLRTSLPAGGFTVTADANDSLLFVGYGWSGAFTAHDQYSAITLRKDPARG